MVYYVCLYKLKPDVSAETLENMIRASRSQLLRVPEVLHIRSGQKIDADGEWPFFVAIEFDSMDKMKMGQQDPIYIKFKEEVIRPYTTDSMELRYETEPGKDPKYS